MSRRHPALLDIPLAVGSSGVLLIGASHIYGKQDPVDLAEQAILHGSYKVFVGLHISGMQQRVLLASMEDPLAELVARLRLPTHPRGSR